jgi:hypothetical protein
MDFHEFCEMMMSAARPQINRDTLDFDEFRERMMSAACLRALQG